MDDQRKAEEPRDNHARKVNEVTAIAVDVMCLVLKEVLPLSISQHYSERDCDSIIASASLKMARHLSRHYPLAKALAKSDLYTPEGKVNMEAVIVALADSEERVSNPAHKAQLNHLAGYVKHVYEGLRGALGRAS